MYKLEINKAARDITWGGNELEVQDLIYRFFGPQKTIKRIQLYFNDCNKNGKYKNFSLFGFYCQLKKRERQLVFIDWKCIHRSTRSLNETDLFKQILEIIQQNPDFKKEYYDISIEELIQAYVDMNKDQQQIRQSQILHKEEEKRKKQEEKIKEKVFGEEKYKQLKNEMSLKSGKQRYQELAQHKDNQQRKKILLELKRKFPHDIVLQRLIKEEFKEYKPFKYPEEYDKIDEDEEFKCKFRGKTGLETKELGEGKELLNTFKRLDENDLYMLQNEIKQQRGEEYQFEKFVRERVERYLEMMKQRMYKQEDSLRQFVSSVYHTAKERYPKLVNKRYPHYSFGQKEDSETYKKSYPRTFKKFFFSIVKSYVKTKRGGYKRVRQAPPTFILPGGKRCHMHDFGCPEDCKFITLNQRVVLRTHQMKRKQKDPLPYRSRVWRRKDFKDALKKVYMLGSELENCTFEPEAGSMSKYIDAALQANPNLAREGFLSEPDPEAYFNKLGKNFETSHPEVYKAGVLKRSKLKYSQGKYEEAMNGLCEGFNIESLKMHYNPKDMKKFFGELMKKKREERLKKEEEEKRAKSGVDFRQRIVKDAPESQKKKPQEDFENKRLIPILREAYDLVVTLEKRKLDAEKQIRKIEREQDKSKKSMRNFSSYKKSQTRIDFNSNEKVLFKSIMCPLKDQCSKVKKPRWPTSNIRSVTQFGEECPFAHHPMELRFPESINTKLQASYQTIKNINQRIDEEKPRQVFKPAGGLFDCNGCAQKSGKHIGGPCNLCRYKEMADEESKKFTDKKRKTSLMKSMERREAKEIKENNKEMHQIMSALDLDNNYTKKFGFLKKACVLHFYGRYNDAFDEIAKAVKIIQDQKEIEQSKQKVVEKRWRFKLGLDDGFELPIPIETIDPTKVDEKFLKKLDLQGAISLATLKLYIEQVSPMRNEEYSKHAYLNKQIEDYYLLFESAIEDKQQTIKKMKKQVEKLDEEADMMEAFGSGGQNSPERSPDKGGDNEGTIKYKPKKTKMCPVLLEKKFCPLAKQPKCPHAHTEFELERMAPGSKMCERIQRKEKCHLVHERKCPFAHNPIELDLIPTETKMKNLNGVIISQTVKLKNMKPIEAWKPAKSGEIEHTHLMDMTSKKRKRNDDDDDEDDEDHDKKKEKTKKSIFERENVFRKPFESNQ